MSIRNLLLAACLIVIAVRVPAQTTTGLLTGNVTDVSGATIPNASVTVINNETHALRTATANERGVYVVPELSPGEYEVKVSSAGFATLDQKQVHLEVNQQLTVNASLKAAGQDTVIEVSSAPPPFNTTSATLQHVITHESIVELPLNGRQFTQLALLLPGASPQEASQQNANLIALGAGGVIPAVNGQTPRQNNFTMDGTLNNYLFANTFAVSPPPDAIQQFNVQTHITDAEFAISSGANINIATRPGTSNYHGDVWEFFRNDVLDAQTYPATSRLPYHQNQYGTFFAGPVPGSQLSKNTFFALYWEGYRSAQTLQTLSNTFTSDMLQGNFQAFLGTTKIGTDDIGRPEYANEIYDPYTSRPDPLHPALIIRDPYPQNKIPSGELNSAALAIAQKYYPAPNYGANAISLPNLSFSRSTAIASDQTGIRLDHSFHNNDTLFGRYNRSNITSQKPETLPTYELEAYQYAQEIGVGFMHLFSTKSILDLHYGYTDTNVGRSDDPAGAPFNESLGLDQANPIHNGVALGPQVTITNGYAGINQSTVSNGPQNNSDYHADFKRVTGAHTIGIGGMFYHIHAFSDGWQYILGFTQNATSVNGSTVTTGYGPASFLLGLPDTNSAILGNSSTDQSVNWYGVYAEDQWQATKKLSLTFGLRWDYITPPNYHKIVSAFNPYTGQLLISGAVQPAYPAATSGPGLYNPQYNGFQPRFGLSYVLDEKTVLHAAFAKMDDHNNGLVEGNQDIRVSYPSSVKTNLTLLNRGTPNAVLNTMLPASTYLNNLASYVSFGANQNNAIPYSLEYNAGIERQLPLQTVLKLDYVGSVGRHQFIGPTANTATTPGPGTLASRGQPFPQYGTFVTDTNAGSASYNALQTEVKKDFSHGLIFLVSYTWSKSLDIDSDRYDAAPENFYNLVADWGPSTFDRRHMFVVTSVYKLPFGKGQTWMSNRNALLKAVAGNWELSEIFNARSGQPFSVLAGSDVANVGGGTQRAQVVGDPYAISNPSRTTWLNNAAFALPAAYTFSNQGRNEYTGPHFINLDFTAAKNFLLTEKLDLQFRAELFNALNHTDFAPPISNVTSAALGQLTAAATTGRQIQLALKIRF